MKNVIKIGTRASQLAIKQAELAKKAIQSVLDREVEIITITTKGDKILYKTLDKIGGKGLFVKEIEKALLDKTIDIAVHSMKDMPDDMPDGLTLGGVLKRENPMDALVCKGPFTWQTLPKGAKVGTGSLRRRVQLLAQRPDLNVIPIRGNIMTRLSRLEKDLDAVVLAVAGLVRNGQQQRISHIFKLEEMVPAACQGILALQIRKEDVFLKESIQKISDKEADDCQKAERAFLKEIGADCHAPAGALAEIKENKMFMTALFYDQKLFCTQANAEVTQAEAFGKKLALEIKKQIDMQWVKY